jgi:ATP-dependent Lhr-like helicase
LADGRAVRIELPRCADPLRWVSAEEAESYRQAFGLVEAQPAKAQAAAAVIFGRFLDTHALVGLDDVLARYPFERAWAERQLERWVRAGRAVAVPGGEGLPARYAAPANLEQVQRGSLGLLRREVITCQPAQFADFVLRWQGAHPADRQGGADGLAEALQRLQGVALPVEVWEQTVLPTRVPGYQPRWLDEWVAGGAGVWVMQPDGVIAFLARALLAQLDAPALLQAGLSANAGRLAAALEARGASFLADLAVDTGMSPGEVRSALWELARAGLVSNDQFDVARRGEQADQPGGDGGRRSLRALRRSTMTRPEGRWSLLRWGKPGPEEVALAQCSLLLDRHGVAARELAGEPWLLPWRILYEVLSRLELTGEVRRGYFVEGLSGAQFALPEAAERLQDLHAPSTASDPVVLLHSLDPANLYGSGAAFDIPLLDGGTRPFLRRVGNWLVLRAGRPVLLIEQQGKKLTALASASPDDIASAVACLPGMFEHQRGLTGRYKITVEEWNGGPVTTSPGRELLEAAGFVRDYQGMTLYAAWR